MRKHPYFLVEVSIIYLTSKDRNYHFRRKEGFGLLDLAILMLIAGVLLASYLSVSSGEIISSHNSFTTVRNMQQITGAMEQFFLVKRRLPCPAKASQPAGVSYIYDSITLSSDSEEMGDSSNSCANTMGAVPTNSLGLPIELQLDGWNRRFYYIVDSNLCGPAGCSINSFKNNTATLTVYNQSGAIVTNTAAYILFSCGIDGEGCYTAEGKNPLLPSSTAELDNVTGSKFTEGPQSSNFHNILLFTTKSELEELIYDPAKPIGSVDICNANNQLLASITANIAAGSGGLRDQLNYSWLSQPGDEAVLSLLWALQEACFVMYSGALTPSSKQCPGGSTYINYNNSCICNKGTWNNDC